MSQLRGSSPARAACLPRRSSWRAACPWPAACPTTCRPTAGPCERPRPGTRSPWSAHRPATLGRLGETGSLPEGRDVVDLLHGQQDARADLGIGRIEPPRGRRPVVDPPQACRAEKAMNVSGSASTGSSAGHAESSPIRPRAITAWSRTVGSRSLSSLHQGFRGDRHGALAQGAAPPGRGHRRTGDRGLDQRITRLGRAAGDRVEDPDQVPLGDRVGLRGLASAAVTAASAGLPRATGPSGLGSARDTKDGRAAVIWASIGSESLPRGRVLTASAVRAYVTA